MIEIAPSRLKGTLRIQPSKSAAHRAIFCAALAHGTSYLSNVVLSDDIQASLRAVQGLGLCTWKQTESTIVIKGNESGPHSTVDCGESGTTLRFSIPLAMDGRERLFTGRGRLLHRPLDLYEEICRAQGIRFTRGEDHIVVQGELHPDIFYLRGNISSQFVSGLLLALPRLRGDSRIIFTEPLESKPYVDMTMDTLRRFGVESEFSAGEIAVYGGQTFQPCNISIEGDYSHAAFFAVAAALSGRVRIEGLCGDSLQGDRQIFSILKKRGQVWMTLRYPWRRFAARQ